VRIALHSALANYGRLDAVIAEVRRTAEYGLAGYWAAMLTGQDTLTALALAGREVSGLELGTAVVPIPLRSPFALAQQVATVQQAVGGRLVLGLGTSHETFVRTNFGGSWPSPIPAVRQYLEDLARVMSGEDAQRVVTARQRTPIVLGAVNPAMIALAARHATGVVTWAAGVRTIRDLVLPARDAAGRAEPFRIVASLPVCVTDDETGARSHIAARLGGNDRLPSYQKVLVREGVDGVAGMSLVGTRDQVMRQLDAFEECGVTDFAAHPVTRDRSEADRTWDVLAERAATAGAQAPRAAEGSRAPEDR
jgi:5,10-methylenetetrahydromethanopterin reductase